MIEDKLMEVYNENINIVIPMAGAGSRFQVAGYDVPKPFIEFNGKMMIEHVLSSFADINAKFILVLQEKFLTEQKEQLKKLKNNYTIDFVMVPKLTMGAAITALASHKKINPDYDIIFADSDNIFCKKDINNFINYVRLKDFSGALLTFNSDKPCFSYAQTDQNGYLIKTKEKEVISNHAICGIYYFKDIEQFKDAVIDLVVESDLSKGEFYMSHVYNHLLKMTNKIGVYDIKHFYCVGTPEQLNEYIKRGINV
jgi:dTDP-glucose pyrophosphorylase